MLTSSFIGSRIAAARKKANLSQAELATRVAISAQAVGKWERGESLPGIPTLHRLAELLGVDLNYFTAELPASEAAGPAPATVPAAERPGGARNLSRMNLVDSDFSGLKDLHETFRATNMQRCLFVGAELSGLQLKRNNVQDCDFSDADIRNSRIEQCNLTGNRFVNASLQGSWLTASYLEGCDFTGADLTDTRFKAGGFGKNVLNGARLKGTVFQEMHLQELVFEGTLEDCQFESCAFLQVHFRNAMLLNTFFKNNPRFKRVQFTDCRVDKLTYAFLKNNLADLSGITVIS